MTSPLALFRKRVITPDSVGVTKFVHPGTKDKMYTPTIDNRLFRLSFKKQGLALLYGRAVVARYARKYALENNKPETQDGSPDAQNQ